ncbi:MAG: hypothetical protein UMR38_05765 [Candidatus Izemoplasma sp.]|nr:hypothetical protein [Candidatus Izemoplasma sp.]
MSKYQDFWQWFMTIHEDVYKNIEEKAETYVPLIDDELKKVHPDLVFEISEILNKHYRQFIISADGMADAFKDAFKLKDAFKGLPKWEIVALRQREHTNQHHVELSGLKLGYEDIFFQSKQDENGIYLDIYIAGYDHQDNRYVHAYFLLLDSLIGEYDAVMIIKDTNILKQPKLNMKPFLALRKQVDEYKNHYAKA